MPQMFWGKLAPAIKLCRGIQPPTLGAVLHLICSLPFLSSAFFFSFILSKFEQDVLKGSHKRMIIICNIFFFKPESRYFYVLRQSGVSLRGKLAQNPNHVNLHLTQQSMLQFYTHG